MCCAILLSLPPQQSSADTNRTPPPKKKIRTGCFVQHVLHHPVVWATATFLRMHGKSKKKEGSGSPWREGPQGGGPSQSTTEAATANLGVFCLFSIICLSDASSASAYQYLELKLVWPKHCYYVDVFLHDYCQRLACCCLVLQTFPAQHSHSQFNDYECVS